MILRPSAFFMAQLSHPYMTTGRTIALTIRTFVGKVTKSLLLINMLFDHSFSSKEQVSFNFMAAVTSYSDFQFSSVTQSCPTLCELWSAARQAFLSITDSRSLLKFMSTELVLPSNHLIPFSSFQFFPASGSFPISQFFTSGGQSIGASASASVLPMNIQG